jgi:hypothetical protein
MLCLHSPYRQQPRRDHLAIACVQLSFWAARSVRPAVGRQSSTHLQDKQLTLIGPRPLFSSKALAQYLDDHRDAVIADEEGKRGLLKTWVNAVSGSGAGEGNIEQEFNSRVLIGVLGYVPVPNPEASLAPKPPSSLTRDGTPDVALGYFPNLQDGNFVAVVELKKPGTKLDDPQPGYPKKFTPVEQAFDYARRILGVRWVVVSDMRLVRLYSVDSPAEYESFDLQAAAADNREFRRLYYLLGYHFLCKGLTESAVSRLLEKSATQDLEIQDGFYSAYYEIRGELLRAMTEQARALSPEPSKDELLEATQRLLDRMLFLFYCEDHPDQLIPRGTVRSVTEGARRMPGSSPDRVYAALKALFREVDAGSPPSSGIQVNGYNGELFKIDPILDHIDLPDTLHDREFQVPGPEGVQRKIHGVWGLHAFDFWREVNEHLLGRIFEQSLSDLVQLRTSVPVQLADKLAERKRHGIYYTTELLSDFLATSALHAILEESVPDEAKSELESLDWIERRLTALGEIHVIDIACGSGAFLVSAYREMLREYQRLVAANKLLRPTGSKGEQLSLDQVAAELTQASLLRRSLFGADLLPQAVELAKLALWLRSAKRGEKITSLDTNIVAADSLNVQTLLALLDRSPASFDLVVGNPPWGGELDSTAYDSACDFLGIEHEPRWDSWELFVAIGLRLLREGGRLALVLPDTLLSPEKARTRKRLLEETRMDKLHNLGPDWFGPNVRMGTCVVEARKGAALLVSDFRSVMLTGALRRQVIRGAVPISQVESLARDIPQDRCLRSPAYEIELFRSRRDDGVIAGIDSRSLQLADICMRYRGEEMAKSGLVWECPNCQRKSPPGKKRKGGGYEDKECECGFRLSQTNVKSYYLVRNPDNRDSLLEPAPESGPNQPYLDGDDITRRFRFPQSHKSLRIGVPDWPYKSATVYEAPKILIRQAGVGLLATYDTTGARCPQSVYIYRLRPSFTAEGYSHEFLLGCLLSRTMTYYVFKRFGEVDPARAHAKLTHTRLETLPVPKVDFNNAAARRVHGEITAAVARLLSQAEPALGGSDDLSIERNLRELWEITPNDGAYINGEFAQLPDSQAIRDLFPAGRPLAVLQFEVSSDSGSEEDPD